MACRLHVVLKVEDVENIEARLVMVMCTICFYCCKGIVLFCGLESVDHQRLSFFIGSAGACMHLMALYPFSLEDLLHTPLFQSWSPQQAKWVGRCVDLNSGAPSSWCLIIAILARRAIVIIIRIVIIVGILATMVIIFTIVLLIVIIVILIRKERMFCLAKCRATPQAGVQWVRVRAAA